MRSIQPGFIPTRSALVTGACALAVVVGLALVSASDSWADPPHGRGWKKHKGHKHAKVVVHRHDGHRYNDVAYRVVHRPVVRTVYRPVVYTEWQPRYVAYRPQRVVVVRPAPIVTVAGRIGGVNISAVFGPRATYDTYAYGCNFCDAHYGSWGDWRNHVAGCGHRPDDVQIVYERWSDNNWDDPEFCG
ncbi:MAG: hypothetical protein ACREOU_13370 [Candidatus Eiseniibacteriota bacterium]